MIVSHSTYSRIGLLGNPSDGFGGKTIAAELRDFRASVTFWESPRLQIIPHPVLDPFVFDSLEHLRVIAREDGYYGGTRLLYASCKRFCDYCQTNDIPLRQANFTLEYDTNIPRQVGLGGSSAIVVSALKCLMDFYGVQDEQIPKPMQPQLALAVERDELEIQAGLQDRVAQIYGGMVYMDFDTEYMREHGHGRYEKLALSLLPPLYLAYVPYSTEASGKAHNLVRYRYNNGDAEVIAAMKQFAELAEAGREALEAGDLNALGELMDQNFDLRRRIYSDEVIGKRNLEMVEIARSFGLPAKFTGSGGAIVGILEEEAELPEVERAFVNRGYCFRRVTPVEERP
jgi:glucuronokinase